MSTLDKSPYYIDVNTKLSKFWEGLNEGEFRTTKCASCHSLHYPPRTLCPNCYSSEMEWVNLPQTGVVESYTHVQIPPPGFNNQFYLVAVRMDELDKTILGRCDSEPKIGQKVSMRFEQMGEQAVYVFSAQ